MINKKEILKMAHDVFHRSGGRAQRPVVRPRREWFIGIGLFFVVLIAGGVYTADRYAYFSTIESTIGVTEKSHKKYNHADAEAALQIFNERSEIFNVISTAPIVVDAATSSDVTSASSTETESVNTKLEETSDNLPVETESAEQGSGLMFSE